MKGLTLIHSEPNVIKVPFEGREHYLTVAADTVYVAAAPLSDEINMSVDWLQAAFGSESSMTLEISGSEAIPHSWVMLAALQHHLINAEHNEVHLGDSLTDEEKRLWEPLLSHYNRAAHYFFTDPTTEEPIEIPFEPKVMPIEQETAPTLANLSADHAVQEVGLEIDPITEAIETLQDLLMNGMSLTVDAEAVTLEIGKERFEMFKSEQTEAFMQSASWLATCRMENSV